jgi:hypothetical protein
MVWAYFMPKSISKIHLKRIQIFQEFSRKPTCNIIKLPVYDDLFNPIIVLVYSILGQYNI